MRPSFKNDFQDELAFEAALFIASDKPSLNRFLSESGASIEDLKKSLQNSEIQAALLDFLLSNDLTLQRFCSEKSYSSEEVWKARRHLPGFPTWGSI